jgi:hypothetical protein
MRRSPRQHRADMAGTLCTTEHQDVAELGPISGFPERLFRPSDEAV